MNKIKKDTHLEFFFNKVIILLIAIIFIISVNFSTVSLGGVGLSLPPNIAIWFSISFFILHSLLKIIFTKKLILSPLIPAVFLTLVILVFIGLINTNSDNQEIILIVLQLVGFLLVFISITQYKLSSNTIQKILYIIVFSSIIQVIYATAQIHHNPLTTPTFLIKFLGINKPPVGGFLQVNALSIFLVTSVIISIYLLFQKIFQKQRLMRVMLLFSMFGNGYILATISSRAALLSLGLSVLLILFSQWVNVKKRTYWTTLLLSGLSIGLLVGFIFGTGLNKLENKTVSTRLFAWSLSIEAIKEQPLLGHGLGDFPKAFFDQNEKYSRQIGQEKASHEVGLWGHPHNELLYWGVQSGLIGVFSILLFVLYYILLLFRIYKPREALQYIALLLPITLSTQVSLPFYLSTLVMLLFVFLISFPITSRKRVISIPASNFLKNFLIVFFTLVFLSYSWFLKETLRGGIAITNYVKIENSDFSLIKNELNNPYWGTVATNYAHQLFMNIAYNRGDKVEARKHLLWFEDQLKIEEEPMYYEILLNNYPLFHEKSNYETLREKAKYRYPKRFDHYPEKL